MSKRDTEADLPASCCHSARRHWIAIGIVGLLASVGAVLSIGRRHSVIIEGQTPSNSASIMAGIKNKTKIVKKFDDELLARAEIMRAKAAIFQFWNVRLFPKFLQTMHIPEESWLTFKYKFVDLIMNNKDDNSTSFVIGFSGSSVTAGHDNFLNESYPAVLERNLQPVFSRLGIKLDVRNHLTLLHISGGSMYKAWLT